MSAISRGENLESVFDIYRSLAVVVIKHLGGTVPDVEEPPTWTTRADRAKRKRAAVQACYKELQRLVGPPVDKLAYLKVLNNGTCPSCPGEVLWADYLLPSKSWRG
jgi:hypothetical protein